MWEALEELCRMYIEAPTETEIKEGAFVVLYRKGGNSVVVPVVVREKIDEGVYKVKLPSDEGVLKVKGRYLTLFSQKEWEEKKFVGGTADITVDGVKYKEVIKTDRYLLKGGKR